MRCRRLRVPVAARWEDADGLAPVVRSDRRHCPGRSGRRRSRDRRDQANAACWLLAGRSACWPRPIVTAPGLWPSDEQPVPTPPAARNGRPVGGILLRRGAAGALRCGARCVAQRGQRRTQWLALTLKGERKRKRQVLHLGPQGSGEVVPGVPLSSGVPVSGGGWDMLIQTGHRLRGRHRVRVAITDAGSGCHRDAGAASDTARAAGPGRAGRPWWSRSGRRAPGGGRRRAPRRRPGGCVPAG